MFYQSKWGGFSSKEAHGFGPGEKAAAAGNGALRGSYTVEAPASPPTNVTSSSKTSEMEYEK